MGAANVDPAPVIGVCAAAGIAAQPSATATSVDVILMIPPRIAGPYADMGSPRLQFCEGSVTAAVDISRRGDFVTASLCATLAATFDALGEKTSMQDKLS